MAGFCPNEGEAMIASQVMMNVTTARLMTVEIDASGPYDINDGDTYDVTPTTTFAP